MENLATRKVLQGVARVSLTTRCLYAHFLYRQQFHVERIKTVKEERQTLLTSNDTSGVSKQVYRRDFTRTL